MNPSASWNRSPQTDEEFRPRLLVWNLSPAERTDGAQPLSTAECLLVLEGIAKTAKSIIVITGDNVVERTDLFEIISYGTAFGLKMGVEVRPADITLSLLRRFAAYKPNVFRLVIDGILEEAEETRYAGTPAYQALEESIQLLRAEGYEVHLVLSCDGGDERALTIALDYGLRRAARGVFCHLHFNGHGNGDKETGTQKDNDFIMRLSALKQYLPDNMYVSPQCIKYAACRYEDDADVLSGDLQVSDGWFHICMGGRSYAYLSAAGKMYLCGNQEAVCGDLREEHFDFAALWEKSALFGALREHRRSCSRTREDMQSQLPASGGAAGTVAKPG
jgi:MoaA/NifB/PqqE/SkfB family radical SAM enzyme